MTSKANKTESSPNPSSQEVQGVVFRTASNSPIRVSPGSLTRPQTGESAAIMLRGQTTIVGGSATTQVSGGATAGRPNTHALPVQETLTSTDLRHGHENYKVPAIPTGHQPSSAVFKLPTRNTLSQSKTQTKNSTQTRVGEFGEASSSQTNSDGPDPPSEILISQSAEGAHFSWERPPPTQRQILEYCVFIGVFLDSRNVEYEEMYTGPDTQCTVSNSSLQEACSGAGSKIKPAIRFRIKACNDYGYGRSGEFQLQQDFEAAKSTPESSGAIGTRKLLVKTYEVPKLK